MFQRKGYVYRFLGEKNEVLYVGKTTNMKIRMNDHFHNKNNHLRKMGKDDLYDKVCKIEYITCKDEFTALQKELYYINLYKPRYNTASKIKQIIDPSQDTDKWKLYKVVRAISKEQERENKRIEVLVPVIAYIFFFLVLIGYFM